MVKTNDRRVQYVLTRVAPTQLSFNGLHTPVSRRSNRYCICNMCSRLRVLPCLHSCCRSQQQQQQHQLQQTGVPIYPNRHERVFERLREALGSVLAQTNLSLFGGIFISEPVRVRRPRPRTIKRQSLRSARGTDMRATAVHTRCQRRPRRPAGANQDALCRCLLRQRLRYVLLSDKL